MLELLSLPIELQIILVAGYLGFKVSAMGRGNFYRTEDFFFQIIVFGTFGRACVAVLQFACSSSGVFFEQDGDGIVSTTAYVVAVFTLFSAFFSIVCAVLWRCWGARAVSTIMQSMGVYRDDHHVSTWRSITNANATWSYVQLHADDGNIYETNFGELSQKNPLSPIVLNDDGIAMYVTHVYRSDDTETAVENTNDTFGSTINYFPRETIKRLEIGWLEK